MNENIDLTKILENCPKGTKLYTSVWGEVTFIGVNKNCAFPICIYPNICRKVNLTKDGCYAISNINSKCILFPSKYQRDWSKFAAPWYKKETGTINTIEKQCEQASLQINERAWLYLVSDVLTWNDGIGQYLDDPRVQELAKKLCSKYAQKLYNPSILSNSLNIGKNKHKFDPKTLKPFDKVLMRDFPWEKWNCQFFSYISNNNHPYAAVYGLYKICIPYNDETKHLVGTNEEAPEYYRYWKD